MQLLRHWLRRIKKLAQSPGVFPSPAAAVSYVLLADRPPLGRRARLKIRALHNETVVCRSGTTDPNVLWSTFHAKYHLPDVALRADCCILDLGANVGYTAAHFSALFPNARVVAVEMDEKNFRLACENTKGFSGCQMIHGAVSSVNGTLTYGGDREDGFHLLPRDALIPPNAKHVRSLTMTTLCNEAKLDRIDFLKMDIEGAEHALFSSDTSWLDKVYHAKIEIHDAQDFTLVASVLKTHGFESAKDTHHWSTLVATNRRQK